MAQPITAYSEKKEKGSWADGLETNKDTIDARPSGIVSIPSRFGHLIHSLTYH